MRLNLQRVYGNYNHTLGILTLENKVWTTLEDPHNEPKIPGNTRIPAGTYDIKLREGSPKANRYREKFGPTHKGMIWLQDVPDFEWVYIHIGNGVGDTEGCILVGQQMTPAKGLIHQSTQAYQDLFPLVIRAVNDGQPVSIKITDVNHGS